MKDKLLSYLIILLFTLNAAYLPGQSSFQKSIADEDIFSYHNRISKRENTGFAFSNILVVDYNNSKWPVHVFETDNEGLLEDSYLLFSDSTRHSFLIDHIIKNNHNILTVTKEYLNNLAPTGITFSSIYYSNVIDNIYWARKTSDEKSYLSRALISSDSFILVSNHDTTLPFTDDSRFGLCKLDMLGNTVWNKSYSLTNCPDSSRLLLNKIVEKSSSEYLGIGSSKKENDIVTPFFLKINSEGDVLSSKSFSALDNDTSVVTIINNIQFQDDHIFLGLTYNDGILKYGGVVKLDTLFNPVWAKRIIAENLKLFNFRISTSADGKATFAYVSNGDFPTALGVLDENGNLVDYKGYSLFNPEILLNDDGSVLISSTKFSSNSSTLINKRIIAKTKPDRTFDVCDIYPVCLDIDDFELEIKDLTWDNYSLDPLPYMSISIAPLKSHKIG